MSIERLREVACQRLPLTISDADQLDELRVLMAAGLIVGLQMRAPQGEGASAGPWMIRVLAITADGRRLLVRSGDAGSAFSAAGRSDLAP